MIRDIRQLVLVLVIQAVGAVAAEAQLNTVQGRVREVEGPQFTVQRFHFFGPRHVPL